MLLTQSRLWATISKTESLQYVEESLCAPLSMIPTIYGLRLANHVELGSAVPSECGSIPLCWYRAPRSENLPISNSSTLERCLRNLEKKCYFVEEEQNSTGRPNYLSKCYTPLTLSFATARMDATFRMQLLQSDLAPRFDLARQTLNAWTNDRPVTLVTVTQPMNPELQRLYHHNKLVVQALLLRIVLVPRDRCDNIRTSLKPVHWAAENPQAHYIDNLDLVYHRKEDGSCHSIQVSFLLPHGHGLEESHSVSLVDVARGSMVMFFGPIKDMHQQDFNIPHPMPPVAVVTPQGPHMQVVRCQESESIYYVQILIHAVNDPQGK